MNGLYELKSFGVVRIHHDIWFPNRFFNALIRMDVESGKIRDIKKFPDYGVGEAFLYMTVIYIYGKLIFVPGRSEKILSYCVETGEFISICMDLNIVGKEKLYFWNACAYGQYIYMFPRKAKCIVRYNVLDNSIVYLENYLNEVICALPENTPCFSAKFEILNRKVYMPFAELNAVAVFDVKDESIDIKYMNIEGGCTTINYVDGYFYLASFRKPCIYRWEIASGEIKIYNIFTDKINDSVRFLYAHKLGKSLFFYSMDRNMLVSLSLEEEIERKSNGRFEFYNTGMINYLKKEDGSKNYILIPHIDAFALKEVEYGIEKTGITSFQDDLYNKTVINNYLMEHGYFHGHLETGRIALEAYIEVLVNTEKKKKKEITSSYGQLIFNKLQNLY